ncbi:hypothetical protein DXB04_23050 [Enterocloster bolteae]|uniref:Uncharacterized protein n=1 Tax=Enterocloster bolteae TaxID=208479 RepID=A0A412ZGB9_9FIRM|nr:hypothetical protein [Enterocloster bolteae]RGK72977.1 hypothetical protein DXC96_13220 [Enterocloster bolteae]RGO81844.1 hypothetical protein DXB04_23050 [Enterocloster bolteae]RGQ59778.1 hypothetical protein DWY91_16555 [Enterocloster bolteae]RGS06819.1 hypothetical protein DWY12_20390 [Enterocloster bolteae]RGV79225.1 hypothetical protein DWW02_05780 [Enterocloster bolteae]
MKDMTGFSDIWKRVDWGFDFFRIFWEAAAQTAAHDCREGLREQRFVLAGIEGKKEKARKNRW